MWVLTYIYMSECLAEFLKYTGTHTGSYQTSVETGIILKYSLRAFLEPPSS